jgi:uncharacterized membrane protein (UPF0127 family)
LNFAQAARVGNACSNDSIPKKLRVSVNSSRVGSVQWQANFFLRHNAVMKRLFTGCVLAAALLGATASAQNSPQTNLPHTFLSAGFYQIDAQVAQTQEQHAVGLMFRTSMPPHEGMLFVFPAPSRQCFWMKNTNIALTAAFVDDDGTITNLEDMKPQTTDSHCSIRPVRFVLEMNQGWFAKKNIGAGFKLNGKPFGQ